MGIVGGRSKSDGRGSYIGRDSFSGVSRLNWLDRRAGREAVRALLLRSALRRRGR